MNPKIFEHLDKIDVTTNRISRIVSHLRSFTRNSDADPFQLVQLLSTVHETLELCSEKLKFRGIEIRVSGSEHLYVHGNSIELSQILMNLISNSCDAIENLAEKWIEIELSESGGDVLISVTDSGRGIPLEVASKMMNPFFTTKEVGKGTGIGLSIALGKTQKHGGSLIYDDKSDHTRFIIRLPKVSTLIQVAENCEAV